MPKIAGAGERREARSAIPNPQWSTTRVLSSTLFPRRKPSQVRLLPLITSSEIEYAKTKHNPTHSNVFHHRTFYGTIPAVRWRNNCNHHDYSWMETDFFITSKIKKICHKEIYK